MTTTPRVEIQKASLAAQPAPASLRRWARATLHGIGETGSLCIRVVDIEEMAELNSRYRHKQGATNVLSFAALCGVSPVDASSGRRQRHRLNRGGNRDANRALWVFVMARMAPDPRTRRYVERRTGEGLSKKEIIRCLKRYIAREIYTPLVSGTTADTAQSVAAA